MPRKLTRSVRLLKDLMYEPHHGLSLSQCGFLPTCLTMLTHHASQLRFFWGQAVWGTFGLGLSQSLVQSEAMWVSETTQFDPVYAARAGSQGLPIKIHTHNVETGFWTVPFLFWCPGRAHLAVAEVDN